MQVLTKIKKNPTITRTIWLFVHYQNTFLLQDIAQFFVCLCVCLFACLFVCVFVCLLVCLLFCFFFSFKPKPLEKYHCSVNEKNKVTKLCLRHMASEKGENSRTSRNGQATIPEQVHCHISNFNHLDKPYFDIRKYYSIWQFSEFV